LDSIWRHSIMTPILGIMSSKKRASAIGGTVVSDATYYYHIFYSNGTFQFTATSSTSWTFDAIAFSGGNSSSGGVGGSGGRYTLSNGAATTGSATWNVVIGAGGTGGVGGSQSTVAALSLTSGTTGFSAGGSTGYSTGAGYGGGGGAGGSGVTGTSGLWYSTFAISYGGAGGIGYNPWSSTALSSYGAGGGGAATGGVGDAALAGGGGSAGGGNGGTYTTDNVYNQSSSSGSQGGGSGGYTGVGAIANGGSGIVVIRYARSIVGG
jgi:hypothetical protein